uniref:Uncharacterized protein n=1 Tax=Lepeophtheirus salmonis TaxID=72036 RepID=A0A0K2V902_LEPSM
MTMNNANNVLWSYKIVSPTLAQSRTNDPKRSNFCICPCLIQSKTFIYFHVSILICQLIE